MDKRIFLLKKYIIENLHRKISVGELASQIELSVSHLYKLFKNETGFSPVLFINNLRVEEAQKILLAQDFSVIKQVAMRVGFCNSSTLAKEFKKKYKISPKEYCDQIWKEQEMVLNLKNRS